MPISRDRLSTPFLLVAHLIPSSPLLSSPPFYGLRTTSSTTSSFSLLLFSVVTSSWACAGPLLTEKKDHCYVGMTIQVRLWNDFLFMSDIYI
jgi:hypothetical protein